MEMRLEDNHYENIDSGIYSGEFSSNMIGDTGLRISRDESAKTDDNIKMLIRGHKEGG